MTGDSEEADAEVLSPDEAFKRLGNEIRVAILQELGAADEPVRFSDLRKELDVTDSGKFNYHLDQLTGHFIEQTAEGYQLRRPGERIIQAVLSGAVTESPTLEPTSIDWRCHRCGAEPIEVDYREEQVGVYCTSCEGIYGGERDQEKVNIPAERERLYYLHLPPAGIVGRSPKEAFVAASRWTNAETVTAANGICPRCSARLVESATVCRNHTTDSGLCDACNNRYAVMYRVRCTNCVYELEAIYANKLMTNLELRSFLIDHGLNPHHPQREAFLEVLYPYEEDIHSVDPLAVTFTFTGDEESISLSIDDSLEVVNVERTSGAEQ
ncbi:ArsR family transcriptional regulator [Halalkaliarchaeum desulfuricum]|uniref:ArsR family transcriptional regulator n=1 Tax=Halalkaliarchaeum desulfuricum TaxID=2055893 RepID=A0A343TJY3_9EURY|nr:winged helix-turn-helix domain-containing protein [Halalkaliarchaeum desulfuricum]AUX09405.1 ArsR family transcriptional regulator [Halalkaliarchaeum desulfuricum]